LTRAVPGIRKCPDPKQPRVFFEVGMLDCHDEASRRIWVRDVTQRLESGRTCASRRDPTRGLADPERWGNMRLSQGTKR